MKYPLVPYILRHLFSSIPCSFSIFHKKSMSYKEKLVQYTSYLSIRSIGFPISLLPLKIIHLMGKGIGMIAYYTMTRYRKRTFSNLCLAETLAIKDLKKTAKRSFQSLAITILEYAKFARIKKTKDIVVCENPQVAEQVLKQGTGVIFFCAHQANWELLFLEGTQRMAGIAVGRPIKNTFLYHWIVSIREKFGGMIITPKETMKEGLRVLKKGKFLGIVGDQALPESHYPFDFFGRRAWTTPAPAILAYRTRCPIIVATIKRSNGKYSIHYSNPIWSNPKRKMEEEIHRMMKQSLLILEEAIRKKPDQWLWQHNRWKQEFPHQVYYRYRLDTLLIILPIGCDGSIFGTFRQIYPKAFITIFLPKNMQVDEALVNCFHILRYQQQEDLFITDYRFKLVFNFSGNKKLRRHFLKQSAFEVLDLKRLKARINKEDILPKDDLSTLLKKALTRPNTLWKKNAP